MGCDGGTIPTRDELVKLKKKPEQKDRDSERVFKWNHCALTQEALQPPIVSCQLGRLYSKESILEFLLDKSKFQVLSGFDHIRGLKDVKTLELTINPAYKATDGEKGGVYIDTNMAPYICPVSGLEMNGKYRFCYLYGCGCVFAERALREIKTETCNKCGKPYHQGDVIVLNGTEEDIERMRSRMEERKLHAKLQKKANKRKIEETVSDGKTEASDNDPSTSKLVKSTAVPGSSVEGITSKTPSGSKLATTRPTAEKKDEKKKPKSIQKDGKASEAYKSLFTSHETCINQPKAHWVTHNPCYY